MPPKMKAVMKNHKCEGKMCIDCRQNPRVIIQPILAYSSRSRYSFNAVPPIASLYNKPDHSDIKLKVGDDEYYSHRIVLCAASGVFSKMMESNWAESRASELTLQEDEDCVKVFDQFLYYMYTGSITICEAYVIPLFMLADKYDVKALYEECVKVILNGLKVFVVRRNQPSPSRSPCDAHPAGSGAGPLDMSSGNSTSSNSDSTDSDFSDSEGGPSPNQEQGQGQMVALPHQAEGAAAVQVTQPHYSTPGTSNCKNLTLKSPLRKSMAAKTHLVASETFPLTLVMKMLMYCHNKRISSTALYNMEARLGNQIRHNNFSVWNELDQDLLEKILADTNFHCNEYVLFQAVKSWLTYKCERKTDETLASVLGLIRYPLLSPLEIYEIESDDLVAGCPPAVTLVQQAIRYRLFKDLDKAKDKWQGPQFEHRQIKKDC